MFEYSKTAAVTDAEVWKYIEDEMQRQEQHIEMIASENYASPCLLYTSDAADEL